MAGETPTTGDINAQNRLQTTPSTVDGQIQPNDITTQPTQPTVQPAPDASNLPVRTNTGVPLPQPSAPAKPHLFDLVLRNLDPTPKFVFDAKGNRVENPMPSKKSMTSHILAGAITSIIQGAQAGARAGATAKEGPAGTMGPANLAAAAAGAQTGAQVRADITGRQQQQIDEQQVRKAAALKNTLSELQNQVAIDKLHDEDWSSKEDYYTKAQDTFRPVLNDFENSDKSLAPGQPSLFAARGLSHDDAMKQMQGHQGELQPIQDGWTTQTTSDGKTFHVPTYSLVRADGQVNTSRETLGKLAQYDSRLANILANNSANSIPFTPTMLVSLEKNAHQGQVAEQFINNIRHGLGFEDVKGFNSAYRDDPTLRSQVDSLASTIGSLGTHSTASALEEFMQGGKGSLLMKFFGKSQDELQDYVNDKKNEALEESSKAKAAGGIKIAQIRTQGKPMTTNLAASILADPNANPLDKARAESFHSIEQNWKDTAARAKAESDRAIKVGDSTASAKLLYEGTLTLSQLKARSSDARFITEVTAKAQQMAQQNGETTWTPQVSEAQFKQAGNQQNVQFFGAANSMLSPTGTLSQLAEQYAKLGNVAIPILNTWKDYLDYQIGDPAMAGFMQTVIGLADDYAKVMGGGTATDAGRLQQIHAFANAHNPEQMAAAISAARRAVMSQVSDRIGKNHVMQQMYGYNVPDNAQRATPPKQNVTKTPPPGKFAAKDAQGNIVGYADDAKGTNFVRF